MQHEKNCSAHRTSFNLDNPDSSYLGLDRDILGRVTDQTEGVVPGVAVSIRNINTGLTQTTISDDSGGYVFALLPVGEYAITAELSGFKRETVTGIVLQAGQRARVDLILIVGEVSDEVTVEGMASLIKTDSPDLGVVVDSVKMNELPLNARSFVQLNTLDAGTAERVGNRNSFYNRFGGNFHSRIARRRQQFPFGQYRYPGAKRHASCHEGVDGCHPGVQE